MKILVMGAGKMGSFFIDLLSFEHEVAVFERDPKRMRFTYNCQRFTSYEEIQEFISSSPASWTMTWPWNCTDGPAWRYRKGI